MAYCPSCGTEIATDAARCPNCNAVFGPDSTWKPLPQPPVPEPPGPAARIVYGITKLAVVTVSLLAIGVGALMAGGERKQEWVAASVLAAVAVVAIVVRARVRWSFLVLLAALAFGLTTCAVNFKWYGG